MLSDVWAIPNKDQLPFSELVSLVVSVAPVCALLRISAVDEDVMSIVTSATSSLDFPRLRHLSLVSQPWNPRSNWSTHLRPLSHAFVSVTRGPSVLRLTGMSISWTHLTHYAHLTTFIFELLPADRAPNALELYRMLEAARGLRRMSLNGLEVGGRIEGLSHILLPCLEELHLVLRGQLGLIDVVSWIRAPRLRAFHIGLDGRTDLQSIVCLGPLLAPVTSLLVDEGRGRGSWVRTMNMLMPDLTHIDLCWSSVLFFRAMVDDFPDGSAVWPSLKVLDLADVRFKDIRRFLDARGILKGKSLDLRIANSYAVDLIYNEILWIRGRVNSFVRFDVEVPWYYLIR
ncbi:hypothetical protein DFH06DRAFT_1324024 [Mycena polygramma]|nr:hypothetical protein DFH06DRAFT_1324024 [Mycena polygramma]